MRERKKTFRTSKKIRSCLRPNIVFKCSNIIVCDQVIWDEIMMNGEYSSPDVKLLTQNYQEVIIDGIAKMSITY